MPPNQSLPANEVIAGDCHTVLQRLPDKPFIQTAFLDPPYNIGVDYGSGSKADLLPDDVYLDGIRSVTRECVRRLTPSGSLWLLCPERWADAMGTDADDNASATQSHHLA